MGNKCIIWSLGYEKFCSERLWVVQQRRTVRVSYIKTNADVRISESSNNREDENINTSLFLSWVCNCFWCKFVQINMTVTFDMYLEKSKEMDNVENNSHVFSLLLFSFRVQAKLCASIPYGGGGGTAPFILSLDSTWIKWIISTPRPLWPLGINPRYPLKRRSETQSLLGHTDKSTRTPRVNQACKVKRN